MTFFQFPNQKTERKVAKIWLNNIGTGFSISTFKFSKDGIASGYYFHENCSQIKMKTELL